MSDLLSFVSAVIGAYDGPIAFVRDDEPLLLSEAAEICAHEGHLRIQSLQANGAAPFIWGLMGDASPDEWKDTQLPVTAVVSKGDTHLLFWALETPAAAADIQHLADAFDAPLDEPVPTPLTDGWALTHCDPAVVYTQGEFDAVYGAIPAEDVAKSSDEDTAPWDYPTYGHAVVKRPFDESDPLLQREIVVTVGKNRESAHWAPKKMTVLDLVKVFCTHSEGPKDGLSFVLADMVPGARKGLAVKKVYGVGLDIDVGLEGEDIDRRLEKLEHLAMRYTTHSHMKPATSISKDKLIEWCAKNPELNLEPVSDEAAKAYLGAIGGFNEVTAASAHIDGVEHTNNGIMVRIAHKPIPKHRIIIPFEVPYDVSEHGSTQKEGMEIWKKVPEALAMKLGGLPIDKTGVDISRLFYLPRHDKGNAFDISLFGGSLFDWRTLDLNDPFAKLADGMSEGRSKSVTEEGRNLGRWWIKAGFGFLVADAVREYAHDRIRSDNGRKLEVECPFDDTHSNPGDPADRACMVVNAGDGTGDGFVISCRHESCMNKTANDMLGKWIADGVLPQTVLEDEAFNALAPEQAPDPVAAVKIAEEDRARAEYEQLADALTKHSPEEDLKAAIKALLVADPGTFATDRGKTAIKSKAKMTAPGFTKLWSECKRELADLDPKKKGVRRDPEGRVLYLYQGSIDFHSAASDCTGVLLKTNERDAEPTYAVLDKKPVKLSLTDSKRAYFRELSKSSLWAELNNRITFVRLTDGEEGRREAVARDVSEQVFENCHEHLPVAPEIVYTPIFVSDPATGAPSLISEPGWYENLRLFMPPQDIKIRTPAETPTAAELQAAVDLILNEVLVEFPFVDRDDEGVKRRDPSQANAVAMLLTPFMRRMITSCTPVFFVSKPTPGTGGTMLGRIPILLFDGEESAPMVYTANPEEMAKSLLANALEGKSHMFFDDVREFNNREILRATTSLNMGGRLLGQSKTVEVRNMFNWIGTGNNPEIRSEMERRVVWINLISDEVNIQKRVFKRTDFADWLMRERSEIVSAILTMIQYWISVDMPLFTERKQASFEDWAKKVGGVLQVCGIEGFLDNARPPAMDIDEAAIQELIEDWKTHRGGEAMTHKEMQVFADLRGSDLIEGNADDPRTKIKFNKMLHTIENRAFDLDDGVFLVRKSLNKKKTAVFTLEKREHREGEDQDESEEVVA